MEGFPIGLAVGLGGGMVIGISIGIAIERQKQRPMTPEEEKRRKRLTIAGIAITLLGVIVLALVAWLVEV
jgi:heme/copper-type cytochrome/quinol oxidase subunit 2